MQLIYPKCVKRVGEENHSNVCKGLTIKHGKTASGKQRFRCKSCNKTFLANYSYLAYLPDTDQRIKKYLVNGVGIREISELLSLSANTILKRIILIANKIKKPIIPLKQKYEVDEMRTFVGSKNNQTWIVYGINTVTKEVADFSVGRRNNRTLNKVISTLLLSEASQLITDKLSNYGFLIPKDIHNTKKGVRII